MDILKRYPYPLSVLLNTKVSQLPNPHSAEQKHKSLSSLFFIGYLFCLDRYQFVSSNEQNPGDKFYNTTVEVLPSYQRDKKEGILEAENHQDNKFNRTQDGYIQVGKKGLWKYVSSVCNDNQCTCLYCCL